MISVDYVYLLLGICLNTLTGHTSVLFALTLLPNGLLASGSEDTKIMIWNITKTSPLYTLTGHTNQVRTLIVIDQEYLVSGSSDGTIKLWSLTSNYTQVRSWQASGFFIVSLAFDSTLNVLASGDNNMVNNFKVWDSNLWAYSSKRFRNQFIQVFFSSFTQNN
jgi:WD40 repeat protein